MFGRALVKNANGYNDKMLNEFFYTVPKTFTREWEVGQILNCELSEEESEVPDKSLIF
jgi:hypothetical protein